MSLREGNEVTDEAISIHRLPRRFAPRNDIQHIQKYCY